MKKVPNAEKKKNQKYRPKKATLVIAAIIALVIIVIIVLSLFGRLSSKTKIKNNCKYDGEMTFKAQYTNGQYTYTYLNSKWGVTLTDKKSTDPVTTKLCTHINNFPITEMDSMFAKSNATSIDLSSFNTSEVTSMANMFSDTKVTELNFETFDTSKVQNMAHMFWNTKVKDLDLSMFKTNKVTNMANMFNDSTVETLDLSNFDFSKVENLNAAVFPHSNIQKITVKNQKTSDLIKNLNGIKTDIEIITQK